MSLNIAQLLSNAKAGETIKLPKGEFEGSFTINKPCTVVGANTTFWSRKGPLLTITTSGVIIKDTRLEITENYSDPNGDEGVCVLCHNENINFENVEILGLIRGIIGESDFWDFPKNINLNTFPAAATATFYVEIFAPVAAVLSCNIKGISLAPDVLSIGKNKLTLTVDPLKDGTYLYGDIFLNSVFTRRLRLVAPRDQMP